MATKPKKPIEALIPLPEVAKILNMSMKTLRRRIAAKQIAVIRDGNILSCEPDEVRSYIARRRSTWSAHEQETR
jgi:1,2-phenylacetyl-CoA epoxidase PaaB subunit